MTRQPEAESNNEILTVPARTTQTYLALGTLYPSVSKLRLDKFWHSPTFDCAPCRTQNPCQASDLREPAPLINTQLQLGVWRAVSRWNRFSGFAFPRARPHPRGCQSQ